ncbi:MAG: response regulator [Dehalococcoidales bacterium]|nr:response regulator [Dehalococcoidales bacterium]
MNGKSIERVMVIESESLFRQELVSALEKDFFAVTEVSDYFEALWLLNESRPELVIIDEKLSLLGGWETCWYLSHDFGIPAIIVGTSADNEVWIKALEAGADFYLREPFSPEVLSARVRAILRRYKKEVVTN